MNIDISQSALQLGSIDSPSTILIKKLERFSKCLWMIFNFTNLTDTRQNVLLVLDIEWEKLNP